MALPWHCGNTILAFQDQNMRMVGGDHMAGLKYVLPEDYEKVTGRLLAWVMA